MNWEKHGIDISKIRGGKGFCPKCHDSRKNRNDRELSVDIDRGLFNCHHCGFKGSAVEYEKKREYVKPLPRLEKVGEKALKFFESRGISNNTLLRMNVTEAVEWMPQFDKEATCICFNYYRGDDLVNIKFRGPDKSFKLAKDAELVFYNLNALEGEQTAVIVEGEIDCLSMYEAGIYNAVSVPNGASKGNQRLEYLDNCWDAFKSISRVVLATDNDEAGQSLKEELARRLGRERCWLVDFPDDCKDANDVLLKHGKAALALMVENARMYPLEGEATLDELYPIVQDYFLNGYPEGVKTGISSFDELLTFAPGQLTMVTGIPGSGKDEYVNLLTTRLSESSGWVWGIYGFEEPPEITVTKLLEKRTGLAFSHRKNPDHRMSVARFEEATAFVDRHYKFIRTTDINATMDGIIEKAKELVTRYGVNGIVISPWNYIEQNKEYGQSETEYTGKCLIKLITFLQRYGVHCFLIAHPRKLNKNKDSKKYEVPTLYDISGSAHFFNMTHNGISVYRDFETNVTDIYVQKVKWSWLGKIGFCSFHYETMTRQYIPI